MIRISKDKYLQMFHDGTIIGKLVSTMKFDYETPVLYEFLAITDGVLKYLLTNVNPDIENHFISAPYEYSFEGFIEEVEQCPYTEILILNEEAEVYWEV